MKYSVLALVAAGTAALPEVAFCAIQISRRFALNHHRVSTHHRTQVKPQLRGTKDDEHRVGGRKPSFGYRDGIPGPIQDVDPESRSDCWGDPSICKGGDVCIQRCFYTNWWSSKKNWYHCG